MTRSSIRQLLRSTQFEARDNKLVRDALVAAAGARFNDEALGKISSAIELMEKEHRGQTRKGTNAPYAIHPNRIALSILEGFGKVDSEVICAALLHDLIEDAGISPETLAQHFGRRCADLVVTLTRQPGEQRDEDGDRLEGPYLQRIIQAGDDAVLLKAADKLDNLRDAAYHPDSERVNLWVRETYSAYIPLVRSISDRQLCARAEKLLLEAVAQTGDPESPEFLASLLASICYSLTVNSDATTELTDIALPEIATKLYLYLNPEAQYWLDSDGTSVFATRTSHLQLAIRIAQSLRELIGTGDLELLLNLAGLPGAFASGENRRFWKRTASVLVFIQRLLREPGKYKWFEVLTSETNLPLLLALIQSRLYLPASWRSPLWATNLGATLSRRVSELSPCPASTLLSQVLSSRLALTRYLQGTGTLSRTEPIFDNTEMAPFSPEALWAFRIASEYLESQSDDLEKLWAEVHARPYNPSSLPARGDTIIKEAGLTDLADVAQIEATGLSETQAVFESEKAGDVFRKLLRWLVQTSGNGSIRWIHFDALEWQKRRAFWSVSKALRTANFTDANLENAGVLLKRKMLQDYTIITVLPARRFAIRDRLPELKRDTLKHLAQSQFTATAMFDTLIMDQPSDENLWLPRIYRVLDTIEDLAPEDVQEITVLYDSPQHIPPLRAYLPLPKTADDSRQPERKRFIARYLVAQIYTCTVVRWVRRVTFSCAAVNEAQSKHAFTEEELTGLVAQVEREYGYKPAYANYVERYGYDPFTITPSIFVSEKRSFGKEQIEDGLYLGIDIGGTLIKFELFRDGKPFSNNAWPSLETPKGIEASEFCRTILLHCQHWFDNNSVPWGELDGIGISWPGAVRNNRLAAASAVLRGLTVQGSPFRDDDPINRLPSLPLVSYFKEELERIAQEAGITLKKNLTIAIQNDGDAEAFGNHGLRLMRGEVRRGGKLFVKLGTSVAGGRITTDGVVAEEVGEYAKVILNLNTPPNSAWPGGTARYYASAVGILQLTRTFEFEGKLLFGLRDGSNKEDHKDRIEPVELGMLLPIFASIEGKEDFLKHLVQFDNYPPVRMTEELTTSVAGWLKNDGRDKLVDYVTTLDRQRSTGSFQSGLDRAIWLCTGEKPTSPYPHGDNLPEDFPFEAMARTVIGTACLFSQLAFQLSHLIAQLYNVYRRGVFSEVILSGGVMAGETGKLVEGQTRAFLSKYYDKIYGPGRSIGAGAVARAQYEDVSNAGIFGAALTANRLLQVMLARSLGQTIRYRMKQCEVGEKVRFDELIEFPSFPQSLEVARSVVESAVMAGSFVWISPTVLQRIS